MNLEVDAMPAKKLLNQIEITRKFLRRLVNARIEIGNDR
jgi:hypothetical protein